MKNSIEYIEDKTEDKAGIIWPIRTKKEVKKNYVRTYEGTAFKLINIQGCPRLYIEYLAIKMDSDNIVQLNAYNKEKFLNDIRKNCPGDKSYSLRTIKEAIKSLKAADMLILLKKGLYQVNPEYYFKGKSEKKRLEMIKVNLEKGIGR